MRMIRVEPGSFMMGSSDGDFDERPQHRVSITYAFYMSETPVTNAQYEQYDPAHGSLRGKAGISQDDDEAVVFVSWYDAVRFCEWLSKKENRVYRLPTEAEWEYACRAGSTTAFHTGDTLPEIYHRHQEESWWPVPVPLHVGRTPANAWGFRDMHGLVEEWCYDWYGPYPEGEQVDPVGPAKGTFKVTRGGSHNTPVWYLRSANRLGTVPEDKHWLIGFRIVCGMLPESKLLPEPPPKRWATGVLQRPSSWFTGPRSDEPYFAGPKRFVRQAPHPERVPMYSHNHQPSITWCDNGDLLAIWFSTPHEAAREMTVLASRLRYGAEEWDLPAEFFKAPDRNMTGAALFHDEDTGILYHFNGLGTDGTWGKLALVMRTSTDKGVSWSAPRLINPEHGCRNQVIHGTLKTREGYLIQPCDAVTGGSGGTAIHISRDGGMTWEDPGLGRPTPTFEAGKTGAWIAGIHAGIVQLLDGRLMALGRGDSIDGRMPQSISNDMGRSWVYASSEFPPIGMGQRLALMRLREGPILLVSFTDTKDRLANPQGILAVAADGKKRRVYGLFAALSFDEGKTWPVKRLVSPGGATTTYEGGGWTGHFLLDDTHGEPMGYLAVTQTPDGIIHLVSSALYYRFNLAWLLVGAA
ncbi:MAG: SUMF1/EgtB/PvdO family nonheme iron enzyme [Limnochordales bacterium]|nr:SUMF1/EgtB/PvdO family nonheme iron enzyme [Limnochordales bacterium]